MSRTDALELLMGSAAEIGPRIEAKFNDLVHPVHDLGRVVAWREIFAEQ